MLDKSIPYFNIIMKRSPSEVTPLIKLPEGYSFVNYNTGDEISWAEIETSVGEFDSFDEALDYFKDHYLPYLEELKKRCIFVQNNDGEKVATFTIWWDNQNDHRVPSVHWVGTKPNYQGLGLGKAIVFEGIQRSISIDNSQPIYLHTQTWSHKAIAIYIKAGFKLLSNGAFGNYNNDFEQALPYIIQKINLDIKKYIG